MLALVLNKVAYYPIGKPPAALRIIAQNKVLPTLTLTTLTLAYVLYNIFMAILRSIAFLIVCTTAFCGSTDNNNKLYLGAINIVEPSESPQRKCQSNQPCYYGYIKVDLADGLVSFRALPTWY